MPVTTEEKDEQVFIDINDTVLADGIEQEIDAKEDWQAKAAPPPKNKYAFKLTLEDSKVEVLHMRGFAKNDPNGIYYKKVITCKIVNDPTWNDSVVCKYGSSKR